MGFAEAHPILRDDDVTAVSRRLSLQLAAGGALLVFRRSSAATRRIDESGFRKIGGIGQWVAVQGDDVDNPAILYLHGGPGEALSPFLRLFEDWEHDFTVAYWDQRGAGKTYDRYGASTPDMTLDRMIDDAVEVAQLVRDRLSKKKVILVGQSWGSVLGVNVVKRRPELFYAFVGTGVPVSLSSATEDRVRSARREATAAGDQAAIKAFDDAESLPADKRMDALAKASSKWILSPPDIRFKEEVLGEYADAGSTKAEVTAWRAGAAFSGSTIGRANSRFDLRKLGLDMPIPFFVVQGRDDRIAGFDSTKAYVDDVRAPAKAFIPIDGGHYACFTNATEFIAALNQHVRSFAM